MRATVDKGRTLNLDGQMLWSTTANGEDTPVAVASAGKTCKLYHCSYSDKKTYEVCHTNAEQRGAYSLNLRKETTERCIGKAATEGKTTVINNTGLTSLKSSFLVGILNISRDLPKYEGQNGRMTLWQFMKYRMEAVIIDLRWKKLYTATKRKTYYLFFWQDLMLAAI